MPLAQTLRFRPTRPPVSARRLAILAVLACLAGCASPTPSTPYGPAAGNSGFGYSGQEITTDRVRVQFAGNARTPRETVETALLRRAAEVTVHRGHDHFIIVEKDTERFTSVQAVPRASFAWGWRHYHPHGYFGWHSPWYGPWGYPYGPYSARTDRRYTASALIALRDGPAPTDNPQAFNAREVLKTLDAGAAATGP